MVKGVASYLVYACSTAWSYLDVLLDAHRWIVCGRTGWNVCATLCVQQVALYKSLEQLDELSRSDPRNTEVSSKVVLQGCRVHVHRLQGACVQRGARIAHEVVCKACTRCPPNPIPCKPANLYTLQTCQQDHLGTKLGQLEIIPVASHRRVLEAPLKNRSREMFHEAAHGMPHWDDMGGLEEDAPGLRQAFGLIGFSRG